MKFFNGKLAAGDTLRLMEEATQNEPDQMQKGFISFSECSSIGLKFSNFEHFIFAAVTDKGVGVGPIKTFSKNVVY
jgi:hypothetical protein